MRENGACNLRTNLHNFKHRSDAYKALELQREVEDVRPYMGGLGAADGKRCHAGDEKGRNHSNYLNYLISKIPAVRWEEVSPNTAQTGS